MTTYIPKVAKKVVGKLITQPSLAKLNEVQPKWFAQKELVELVDLLLHVENIEDLSQLEMELHKKYPRNPLTEDELYEYTFEASLMTDFKASLESLKERYYIERSEQLAREYARHPNTKNKRKLEDALRELEELDIPEDDGSLNGAIEEFNWQMSHGVEQGINSYPKLDALIGGGIQPGTLLTIGARPGVGKTAFGINMALEMLRKQPNMHIDFFTLEMTKLQMLKRFVASLSRVNSYKFRTPSLSLRDDEKALVGETVKWLEQKNLKIHDSQFGLSQIERTIRQRVYEAGDEPYICFIDYLGLVNAENDYIKRNEQIGKITRLLKLLTNELGISVILFSQLNRGVEHRSDPKPTLSDLRESGDVEQDSSIVGFLYPVYPDDHDSPITLDIQKNREGMVGRIFYEFNKKEMRFTEQENRGV